eukprot:75159-Amorphochlora_amoeboformis.AAC.1
MAWQLSSARSWVIGSRGARELIADYGATISVIFFSAVRELSDIFTFEILGDSPRFSEISRVSISKLENVDTDCVPYMSSESRAVSLETLDVPSTFQPTSGRN